MKAKIAAAMLVLTGCAELPWDPEGTLDRVEKSKVLRAGVVSSAGGTAQTYDRFLELIARETGSETRIARGSAEELLPKIEKGELDIVVGHFAADTPWAKRVTIMPTPRQMGVEDGRPAPAAVIRNGENGWVALVYRHAPVLKEGAR